MSYRNKYEEKTGLKVPSSFDIHHIDLNRKNNDINNLVAIPRELHRDYHKYARDISLKIRPIIPTSAIGSEIPSESFDVAYAETFMKIKIECYNFVLFRNKLIYGGVSGQIIRERTYEEMLTKHQNEFIYENPQL